MNKYLLTALIATAFFPYALSAQEATTTPEESSPQEQIETPAPDPVTLTLRVNALGDDIFNGDVTVESPCAYGESSTSTSFNALCALQTALTGASITYSAPWSDFGYFVDEIGGYASDNSRYVYWILFTGEVPAEQGIASTPIANGDEILLSYDTSIMRVTASSLAPSTNSTSTLTAEYFDLSGWPWEWKTATNSVFVINGAETSSTSGIYELWATTTDSVSLYVKKSGLIQSGVITIEPQATVSVEEPSPEPPAGSGGGGNSSPTPSFDLSAAAAYLASKQSTQGDIGPGFYSDWAAIGLSSTDGSADEKRNLLSYILSSPLSAPSLTDHERRAMALLSLGKNPYENGEHIQAILAKFDGEQFGEEGLVNDDIFAIFPLISSGYSESDAEIAASVSFIVSRQRENGSWEGSVDMTSAAIQALALAPSLSTGEALSKARAFLVEVQGTDACFGNTSATSWALQAIAALDESPASWEKSGRTPLDCLSSAQASDGGLDEDFDENSRIWATAYSLPAYQGKTWNSLFARFSKPAISNGSSGGSSGNSPLSSASTLLAPADETEVAAEESMLAYIEELTGLPGSTIIYLYDPVPAAAEPPAPPVEPLEEELPAGTASAFDSVKSATRSVEPMRATVSRGIRIIAQNLLSIFR